MALPRIWEEVKALTSNLSQYLFLTPRTSALTVYMRTNGTASGTGLSESQAVLTFAQAKNVCNSFSSVNANFTINIGTGSFAGQNINSNPLQGGITTGVLTITGQGADSTTLTGNLVIGGGARVVFQNVNFAGTITVREGAYVQFSSCKWTGQATAAGALDVTFGGVAVFQNSISYTGNFTFIMQARGGGYITTGATNNIPITLINAPTYTTGFFVAGDVAYGPGEIFIRGTPAFTGDPGANSKKFAVVAGGTLSGRTLSHLSAIPGSVSGTVSGNSLSQSGQFISNGSSTATGYLLADGTDIASLFLNTGLGATNTSFGSGGYLGDAFLSIASDGRVQLTRHYRSGPSAYRDDWSSQGE